jgi:hypothetical protein
VRWRAALAAVVAGAALTAAVPAAAEASGTYQVTACSPTSSSGAWTQVNTNTAGMTAGNQCGGPADGNNQTGTSGTLYGEDTEGGTFVTSGSKAGWDFTAPAGTVVTGVTYYRNLATEPSDWEAGLFAANGAPIDICESDPDTCSEDANDLATVLTGLDTTGLFFGVYCNSTSPFTCQGGDGIHLALAELYSVSVTLSESSSPSVSGLGGSLWEGGPLWGTGTVNFDASDVSGIDQVALAGSSGQVAFQQEGCNFASTSPCPDLPGGSLSVNTLFLHDGLQTLSLLVTNAAGNATTVVSPTVVIDNDGPPAPTSFAASAISGSTSEVQLTWSNPSDPPAPVSFAQAQVCQGNSCGAPVDLSTSGSGELPVSGPGTYGVRLWLIDIAGRGSASNAATASVTVPPAGTTGNTGPTSKPSLKLTRKLSGRKLTLTATVPKAVTGDVTFTLSAYHGSKRFALTTRKKQPADGSAVVHLTLSSAELKASKIWVKVAAAGAKSATIEFRG